MDSKDLCKLDNGLSKTQHLGYNPLMRTSVRLLPDSPMENTNGTQLYRLIESAYDLSRMVGIFYAILKNRNVDF